jgi:hypothetical protein
LALFNVVIQERKWRKEDPSQTSINKQFALTLSQLAVLALASCIKTPTAKKKNSGRRRQNLYVTNFMFG